MGIKHEKFGDIGDGLVDVPVDVKYPCRKHVDFASQVDIFGGFICDYSS
jgi:hypothetical protein